MSLELSSVIPAWMAASKLEQLLLAELVIVGIVPLEIGLEGLALP